MPYAEDRDAIRESSLGLLRVMQKNPVFLFMFFLFYVTSIVGIYLYKREALRAHELQLKAERLQGQVSSFDREREEFLLRSKNPSIDVFGRLSFLEKSSPQDQEKLQAALSLNSFARYALNNHDLQKAKETLDESVKTYPTLEAQYYRGVVNYLEGNTEEAIGSWKPLAKSSGVPDDIFIYLSLAEYRSGNTSAAKEFADLYSRRH